MKTPLIFGSVAARLIARKISRKVTGVSGSSSFNPENSWDALNSAGASEIGTATSSTSSELSATAGLFSERPISATTATDPTKTTTNNRKMATSVPKKDPKNDFIYLRYCGVFSLFRGSWAAQRQFPDRYRSTLEQPGSFRKYGVYLLLAVVLTSFCRFANGETAHQGKPTPQPAVSENPAVASDLVDVVQAFLAAGEKDDPTARGKYLGPKVFYYGHSRTHAQ